MYVWHNKLKRNLAFNENRRLILLIFPCFSAHLCWWFSSSACLCFNSFITFDQIYCLASAQNCVCFYFGPTVHTHDSLLLSPLFYTCLFISRDTGIYLDGLSQINQKRCGFGLFLFSVLLFLMSITQRISAFGNASLD